MRKRNIVLALAAAPAVAVLVSSCAAQNVAGSNLTVQCTETLVANAWAITGGAVAGTGRCTLTGMLQDSGPTTDYRTLDGTAILIRRVVAGAEGTITFVITINTVGPAGERWTITSGTKTYAELHGRGYEVVDNYSGDPATFVLKGTVSQV